MDLTSVAKLLTAISVHYPRFKQQISTEDGKINRAVGEEWVKRIGYLSYEEADARFEKWLKGPESKYPPTLTYFMNYKEEKKTMVFTSGTYVRYHIGPHGELLDEEGREYGNPSDPDTYYSYDATGHIVQGRRLVQ